MTEEIIDGLLRLAMENEWVYQHARCGRGCCDESYMGCTHCGAKQEDGHRDDCFFVKTIEAAQKYLNPTPNSSQTFWDHISNDETFPCHP